MVSDAHESEQFRQLGRRSDVLRGKAAKLLWVIFFTWFTTASPAQAAVESVPPVNIFVAYHFAHGYFQTDIAAMQAEVDAYNVKCSSSFACHMSADSCDGNGLCRATFTSPNSSYSVDWVIDKGIGCPIPSVNPKNLYLYYAYLHVCQRTVQDEKLSITLSGGSTTEPWHNKPLHDPDHLKSNLPYKAIVKDQNGQFKAGINVTITTDVTSDSGGHVHTSGRPKGKLVAGTATSTKDGKVTIPGNTNDSGIFEFTFGAEEASGTHTLTAKCDSGCQAPATATVDVSIKGLMQLDADPLGYTLTGDRPEHPDNHYFSPAATVKIINLAHRYKKEFNKQKYKNPPYVGIFKTPLVINDSSLKKGGTFDVLQDWTSLSDVHGGHRQGVVVDINGIKEESLDFEEMAEECCKITADWHPGGTGPHYHLKLLGRDQ